MPVLIVAPLAGTLPGRLLQSEASGSADSQEIDSLSLGPQCLDAHAKHFISWNLSKDQVFNLKLK